ncbi:hypothetical protein Ae406Ps2_6150 [Pseudonocardia sp. Ae406_Ps2]|nr:hypothetical protein Ae406Ps2_6146 [Pseudonocardia sp. Ae406_Ps2]OLL96313.1 hypothetical protein Ae406Ps2_6150 [Pseudonocardia sp. Ae406_Ps2]
MKWRRVATRSPPLRSAAVYDRCLQDRERSSVSAVDGDAVQMRAVRWPH